MKKKRTHRKSILGTLCYITVLAIFLAVLGVISVERIKTTNRVNGTAGESWETEYSFMQLGASTQPTAVPVTIPTPEPTPEPTPPPTPEPILERGYTVISNGIYLPSGSYTSGDTVCVSIEDLAAANEIELKFAEKEVSFQWRGSVVKLSKESDILTYKDEDVKLPCEVFAYHDATFVPIESLCNAIGIGLLWDDENQCMYCTPAAGDWELPSGYKVPVFMYHCVEDMPGADLYIQPNDMDTQIAYLVDNGYTPIWFEDLEHVDQYEKPVILTFDDGYVDNYTNLWPIVQKYKVKVSICMITELVDVNSAYLSSEQIKEMTSSGLVMIESHTVTHNYLSNCYHDTQAWEMEASKLDIAQWTGKEPIMLCYPSGMENTDTHELLPTYYRFGMKMTGPTYVTGEDPSMVWRIFIKNSDGLKGFITKLEAAYA